MKSPVEGLRKQQKDSIVIVDLSPMVYMMLCGLVEDTLLNPTDATPLLQRAKRELAGAVVAGMIPSELVEQPQHLDALRRAGMVGN